MLIQAGGAALATMVGSGCARSAPSGGASAGRLLHRVRPSDPAWPRAAAWETLNRQVGGRLIKPAWPLEACRDAPRSERLLAVKDRYDPDGLFLVHHGVGSERWSPDGFTRLA